MLSFPITLRIGLSRIELSSLYFVPLLVIGRGRSKFRWIDNLRVWQTKLHLILGIFDILENKSN